MSSRCITLTGTATFNEAANALPDAEENPLRFEDGQV